MHGPGILVRTLSRSGTTDCFGNRWQYHSRGARHSQVACWGLVFDLLQVCPSLRAAVGAGRVGFAMNHRMGGAGVAPMKPFDLVLCARATSEPSSGARSFAALGVEYGVELSARQRGVLRDLPPLNEADVDSVRVAFEVKACMTDHVKALSRLYDELDARQLAARRASATCITAALAMVNAAEIFRSSGQNKVDLSDRPARVTRHRQPDACASAVARIKELPARGRLGDQGFDAVGIVVVDCANDGSAVRLVKGAPAPPPNDLFHYESMVRRIAQWYEHRFANA